MKKVLRCYQERCIQAILKALEESASTLAVLATGAGKTVIAGRIASEWPRGNVLFLAERVELLDQAADKLTPELGYRPPIEQAERRMDTNNLWQGGAVIVGSVQTMRNKARLEEFKKFPFDLIIIDECVTGDTLIETDIGKIPIKNVPASGCKSVMTYNRGKVEYRHISAFMPKGKRRVLEIALSSGKSIRCTANHPIFTSTGWVKAEEVRTGNKVLCLADADAALFWDETDGDANADSFQDTPLVFASEPRKNGGQSMKNSFSMPHCAAAGADSRSNLLPVLLKDSYKKGEYDLTPAISHSMTSDLKNGKWRYHRMNDKPSSERFLAIAAFSTQINEAAIHDYHLTTEAHSANGPNIRHHSSQGFAPIFEKETTADMEASPSLYQPDVCQHLKKFTNLSFEMVKKELAEHGSNLLAGSGLLGGSGTTDHAAATDLLFTPKDTVVKMWKSLPDGLEIASDPLHCKVQKGTHSFTFPPERGSDFYHSSIRICQPVCNTNYERVVSVRAAGEEEVFDISVDETHCFFANGILVHNCHHAPAPGYRRICDFFLDLNPCCKILGITATPCRTDKKALGVVFNSCAFEYPIVQAIEDGYLTPIRQEIITIENIDFSNVRLTKNDFGETDFNLEDLHAILIEEEPLHALAKPIIERSGDRSVVVFTAGVPHAHLLAAILNREQPGSAAAMDGTMPPGSDARKRILRSFTDRQIKYICNYAILTEGWDCDFVAAVAMGRPTKSRLVYEQMLGRVLRPLDGVVDGCADASDRKMSILTSDKPYALCMDFVGNSKHQLVTVQDVLGGNYDQAVRERAKENSAKKQVSGDVLAELRKARAELILEKEQQARRQIRAQVEYQVQETDPFGHNGVPSIAPQENMRGGSSDAQIALLCNLGVKRETATRYTKRQASAVIEDLKSKRCTSKQYAILKKYGENPDVPFDMAKKIIDEIAANGWKAREKRA